MNSHMQSHRESGRVYLALFLVAAAVVAFFILRRETATFSKVELRMAEGLATAERLGMPPEQVLAVLDLNDSNLDAYQWVVKVEAMKEAQAKYGDLGLAIAAAQGQDKLVAELFAADAKNAPTQLRGRPEGLVATRYLAMVERYRVSLASQR